MTLQPLLAAAPTVQLHAFAAAAALIFSAAVFLSRKGTARHRLLGRIAGAGMAVTALSSFFITRSGAYSWIHVLSVVTLASLTVGVYAIRTGHARLHQRCMIGAAAGLIIAGGFTLLPGRIMSAVMFGG